MGRLVTWYVTPSERSPARYDEAPDDAAAEVETDVVRSAVEALRRLFRPLAHLDERIAATAFAGMRWSSWPKFADIHGVTIS